MESVILKDGWVVEWDEILPFNPNSTDQLKAFARHHGHPIGADVRDSTKETMDAGHLKVLAKEYPSFPFYKLTLEFHKLSKTLGTYIYDPDADGLIHTTYKNQPSTPKVLFSQQESPERRQTRRQHLGDGSSCAVDCAAGSPVRSGGLLGHRSPGAGMVDGRRSIHGTGYAVSPCLGRREDERHPVGG
jgi:hypothetical protein